MIRLLFVEDDLEESKALEEALLECEDLAVDKAEHASEARRMISDNEYDLVVLDLALPLDGRRLSPQRDNGIQILRDLNTRSPGTPVFILSGHADLQLAGEFSRLGGANDLFGLRSDEQMVQYFPKENLPECVKAINHHLEQLIELEAIRFTFPKSLDLSDSERRALAIYVRRAGGAGANLRPSGDGMSGATTLEMEILNFDGTRRADVAVKLGPLMGIVDEAERSEDVAGALPFGLAAPLIWRVTAGAGNTGALIYRLATEARSLFSIVDDDDSRAAEIVEGMRERFVEWHKSSGETTEAVQELRRQMIRDQKLLPNLDEEQSRTKDEVEVCRVQTSVGIQHGDMHGMNVLVQANGNPVTIDYGDARQGASCALDPVTLELSSIFHPSRTRLEWPSVGQCESYDDLDFYLDGCPWPQFIRACREWTMTIASSEGEWHAIVWSYSARQLKYHEETDDLARAFMARSGQLLLAELAGA